MRIHAVLTALWLLALPSLAPATGAAPPVSAPAAPPAPEAAPLLVAPEEPVEPFRLEEPASWRGYYGRILPNPSLHAICNATPCSLGCDNLRRLGTCRANRIYRTPFAGQLWFQAEYLGWDVKGVQLPALVTTSPAGTPPADAGQLDDPNTQILFGNDSAHDRLKAGGRLTLGYWCHYLQESGIELSYFGVDRGNEYLLASSDDYPILARPYQDITTDTAAALLVAHPDLLAGAIQIESDSELSGAELLFRRALRWTPEARLDLLVGYRYGRLQDELEVFESSVSLDAASGYDVGTFIDREDIFRMTNNFHGAELGLANRWWSDCWSLSVLGKIAFGAVNTRTTISGATAITDANTITIYDGGLLAQPTNIGNYSDTEFTGIFEFGARLERQICDQARVALGYTLLYWSDVGRLADHLDTGINPTQLPPGNLLGDPRPDFSLHRTDLWAHGVNLSLEYQF